jgi:hypothetical protein
MLRTICPLLSRALSASQRRARFTAAFGSFSQRTIDRRYCGLLHARILYGYSWYSVAVRKAGGVPSDRCWQPFTQVAPLGSFSCMGGSPY